MRHLNIFIRITPMEGIISLGSRMNTPHGRQDSERPFLAKCPPVGGRPAGGGGGGGAGRGGYINMECSYQKRKRNI